MSEQAFRDSGQAWLGDIPKHWQLHKLGAHFTLRNVTVNDTDYPALSVTMQGIVPQLETAAKSDANDKRKQVLKGDFVINSRSDRKGSSGISPLDGSVSQIAIVLEPKNIAPEYVHYLLRSYPFQEEFYKWGSGIVADLWSTRFSAMKQILIPVPPSAEQDAIVEFLDNELSRINSVVSTSKRLLELLDESYDSRLFQTFAGETWWSKNKLSRLIDAKKGPRAALLSQSYLASVTGPYPVYSGQTEGDGIVGWDSEYDFDLGEIGGFVISTVGSKKVMSLRRVFGKIALSQNCLVVMSSRIDMDFLEYALERALVINRGNLMAHMQASFRMSDLNELWIDYPASVEVQKELARSFTQKKNELELLGRITSKFSSILEVQAQSIIAAAVTGKIERRSL